MLLSVLFLFLFLSAAGAGAGFVCWRSKSSLRSGHFDGNEFSDSDISHEFVGRNFEVGGSLQYEYQVSEGGRERVSECVCASLVLVQG